MSDNLKVAVDAISDQIQRDLVALAGEQRYPAGNADASDDKIAYHKQRVVELRRIRNDLEDTMTGVV
jgi:hypothetical protein